MNTNRIADLALINGTIYTVEPDRIVNAVAVRNGKIIATGTNDVIKEFCNENTDIINLHNKFVLPGFIESHAHPLEAGMDIVYQVNCSPMENNSISDVLSKLADKAKNLTPGSWVLGYGYDDSHPNFGRHLTKQDLDTVSIDHPIAVSHVSVHFTYVNSMALRLAKIDSETKDIHGSKIGREQNGEPNGILMEYGAQNLVTKLIPNMTSSELVDALKKASDILVSVGVTTISDALLGLHTGDVDKELAAYEYAIKSGYFLIRFYGFVFSDFADYYYKSLESGRKEEVIKPRTIKIFSDGSIQAKTGFLLKPYKIDPNTVGILVHSESELYKIVSKAHRNGFQVAIHANGDGAIETVLNVYERVLNEMPKDNHRHRIEHCQMVTEEQLDRIAKLKILPTFLNTHVYYWGDRHRDIFIGEGRASRISPLASAAKRDLIFSLHSDWPVTPVNPLKNISVAVNRITSDGKVLGADQRIGIKQAIKAFTLNAAYFIFEEQLKGSIEIGKLADFVILSHNLLEIKPDELDAVNVDMTIIGGKIVYKRP